MWFSLFVLSLFTLEVMSQQNSAPAVAEYFLETRTGTQKIDLTANDKQIKNIMDIFHFDGKLPLKLIIHGWTEDANKTHYVQMAKIFLKEGIYNIIRVDYSNVARQNYLMAATSVGTVGNYIGDCVAKLIKQYDISMKSVHVIGHSLGGQVSGYVGRRLFEVIGEKVNRISALDPASPLFENNPEQFKITRKDANIVDIVHTDGGVFGYSNEMGTVDFFPNGGKRMQPGCESNEGNAISFYMEAFTNYCSHRKSYIYYTVSILIDVWATKCNSWKDYLNGVCDQNEQILFGTRMPENATGSYYFEMDIDDDYISDILLP